jgi:hypothetical protein
MKKLSITLSIALFFMIVATGAAWATCPPEEPNCPEIQIPECIGCDPVVPDGPGELPIFKVDVNGVVDIKQIQGFDFKIEPCKIEGEAWAGQKAEGIIQLPDVEAATGTISAQAAQLNLMKEEGTVAGYEYSQTAMMYEKFDISVGADQDTPEAAFRADQNDTARMTNEVYENGLYSGASASSCFAAEVYGLNPQISAAALNAGGYTLSQPDGSWQAASWKIEWSINPPAPPTAE